VDITYDASSRPQQCGELVFEAALKGASTSSAVAQSTGGDVVVKFARTFNVEAHQIIERIEAGAPKLLGVRKLPVGWTVIVMEYVSGTELSSRQRTALTDTRLTNIVAALHSAEFVHGDLRSCNTLVSTDDRVCYWILIGLA
jgi:tRNA A-37 threonylcarbamoyl transferase component Bud32